MKGLIEIIEQAAKEGKVHIMQVDAQPKDAQPSQQKILKTNSMNLRNCINKYLMRTFA